jgi:CBS domain-containing protein
MEAAMTYRSVRQIIEGQALVSSPGSMTVGEAARLMRQNKTGAILVVEGGKLAGIFTERDALYRVIAEGRDAQTPLSAVMTHDPQTIHPDRPFSDALHLMYEGGFRHVPVVEDGCPVGMVSAGDALGPELEDFIYELLRRQQAEDILA